MKKIEVELYSEAINAPVLKLPGRAFPGVLIQGDTLSRLQRYAKILKEYAASAALEESVAESAEALCNQLEQLIKVYEETLEKSQLELPYVKPASEVANK